ncbi:alpha/beta fold hydrolase [Lentibacter algarum]|jgi:pimeloyl-ACP methyl ester carboxylesterase|uniref:alpha/beta fold hydrolase n=1 Tax=Lentibacter algarum TaxID=576131 RepID=UPI003BAF604F
MPKFQTSDGLSLYYEDEGVGTPLLCLSGLTRTVRDFDFVAPHLAHMRLVRLDYRGRGLSDWADPSTYTPLIEGRDVLELMDHLALSQAAVLGTSRGGLIAMTLSAIAKPRLLGVALNDVGPELARQGLEKIALVIGKKPNFKDFDSLLKVWPDLAQGFDNVPTIRFREEISRLFTQGNTGLELNYDPALRQGVLAALDADLPDLWPLFEALSDLPICALRGANSNLLSQTTFAHMRERRPDMIAAVVPDRGHVPYLDEPAALEALLQWTKRL